MASRYNEASTHAHQAANGLKLIDMLSPATNSRVLDLGCGTGYLASVLAERVGPGGKVVGVDPDKERIKLAREKYTATSNLVFVEGNSDNFPEGPYDLVFMNYVLHWVKDKKLAFTNIHQSLVAGGQVAFIAVESYSHLDEKVFELINCDPSTFTSLWSCDDYLKLSGECGFITEYHSTMVTEFTFPNVDAYLEWHSATIGNQGQYDLQCIDPAILARFKEQFEDESPVTRRNPNATIVLRKPLANIVMLIIKSA